ncbi:MAG: hypothetical protein M3Q06_13425 [Bacteroidota bacterium]|nr:hypothetical protein [Bacteroidota bacterium]
MKKLFYTLLLIAMTAAYSCNSGNNTAKKEETSQSSQTTVSEKKIGEKVPAEEKTTATASNTEAKATAEMCDCINSSLKSMSPKIQQIFIRAGSSERPLQVLQNEIVTISDKEQEELFTQLQRFSTDPKLQNCSEDIRKKYGLNPEDKAAQDRVLQHAKNIKDCELVYALIKIGMQQQSGN